jgi:mono/diheme cytochrome c family protein
MKKALFPLLFGGLLIVVVWFAIGEMSPAQQRWYSPSQVVQGEAIYSQYCRDCHGKSAGGKISWRTPNREGNYPPPPLDGSGHTWHRSFALLQKTIREGGVPLGGTMPPFEGQLSIEEIDAVIAWFQSLWPIDIYSNWSDREKRVGS